MSAGKSIDRRRLTLDVAARYGLAWVELLQATVFDGLTRKAVERTLAAGVAAGDLQAFPFLGKSKYWMLTERGAAAVGLDPESHRHAWGPQGLMAHAAIASFCLLTEPRSRRLTRAEIERDFPVLAGAGMGLPTGRHRTPYFIDRTGATPRLGLLVVDMGNHPRRIARKARRAVERRRKGSPEFVEQFLKTGLFMVTILTGFEGQAQRLRRITAADQTPVRVAIPPGYGDLVLQLRGRRP